MTKVDKKTDSGYYPTVRGKKRRMAELLVNPDCDLTVTQMCEKIGVSRQTFYNWQQESDFRGYVDFLIENYTDSELMAAWKALIGNVKKGDTPAIKLYFELKGKYKQQIEVTAIDPEVIKEVNEMVSGGA